ncbi:glycosyltransferase family 4 protein [Mucilaginibacter aquaedulcis]|uniref:glycosyltransferase family 4 protein n=1 Tax=Mucilaginibacter aquaedulcis TaxID=1187081 RepID=UPI0025B3B39A|nr:glycosyltransferase family 4 protein [Mucilaginibacter aquaedulcis]MDN3549755.1 glycosyltransferase family 4 protein [Mucilaginibacter aquaedulcis]
MDSKIATISIIEPVGGHGGMDYYCYGLAYGLGKNNVKVDYYTSDVTNIRDFENVETIFTFFNLWKRGTIGKVFEYVKGHLRAFKQIKKKGNKIIHLHFFSFRLIDLLILTLAKRSKFKIVVTVHDVNSFHRNSNNIIERVSYSLIDHVIVHNESSNKSLEEKGHISSPVSIIPHGNYLPFINKIDYSGYSGGVFNLLFFGQIKKVKALDLLIRAVSIVKSRGYAVNLTIAGKAWKSDLEEYTNLISELKIEDVVSTNFSFIPDDEIENYYSAAHLCVLPYKEIYQSGVVLLTMSYGVPLLCSDLPAFADIISDSENGFLFESQNVDSLAERIIWIIDNNEYLGSTVKNANELIFGKFNWVEIGKKTLLAFQN